MSTRRTSDNTGNETVRSEDSMQSSRPKGVRPPSRMAPGVSNKTAAVGSSGGSAPTRFSQATQVVSGGGVAVAAGEKGARGKMTGGQTQLAGAISDLAEAEDNAENEGMKDPIHAWFVIVNGPGKGNSVVIGAGRSAIGRDSQQHVCLDFGDEAISREKHAWITFDDRVSKFYISAGDGRNLCYVNDAPVLTSLELKDRDRVAIGKTDLVFISFCGDEFSWT